MRITDRMRYENPRMRILRLTNRQAQTTEELSTGKRLNRPSDDPLSALKATIFESQGRRVQQQKRNIDAARNTLVISESVLGEASTTLLRVKELAIQSLSSVMSGTDRSFMGAEVSQLREHLRSIANTKRHWQPCGESPAVRARHCERRSPPCNLHSSRPAPSLLQ